VRRVNGLAPMYTANAAFNCKASFTSAVSGARTRLCVTGVELFRDCGIPAQNEGSGRLALVLRLPSIEEERG